MVPGPELCRYQYLSLVILYLVHSYRCHSLGIRFHYNLFLVFALPGTSFIFACFLFPYIYIYSSLSDVYAYGRVGTDTVLCGSAYLEFLTPDPD
jgi:hypothetical protein